ncbi:MAG TPA: ribonuclease HIII [Dictyobacter sp.]|nr:ribonuclease HIII [Dictyobacter sp.]
MAGNTISSLLATLKTFAQDNGWSIITEKPLTYGYQLTISDGFTRVPISLYTTGKILIQGKNSTLQEQLQRWATEQTATPKASPVATPTLFALPDQPTSPNPQTTTLVGTPHIGSDESGKGDYFGPLVVAAVYIDPQTEPELLKLGVRDSKKLTDARILQMEPEILALCQNRHALITYLPEEYNQRYTSSRNVNLLLANAHAELIEKVADLTESEVAIVDQFGDEALVRTALTRLGCTIRVEQRPRAEDDTAVATASILARAAFVRQIQLLSQQYGYELLKGASNPQIIEIGRAIVRNQGIQMLHKVAKVHFRTTETILQTT